MKRRSSGRLVFGLIVLCCGFDHSPGQEGAWSLSISGGPSFLNLTDVNKTLDETVADWNQRQVPIGTLKHFSPVLQFSFGGAYRYERNMAAVVSVSYFSQTTAGTYRDSSVVLNLDRSVGAAEIAFGLSYIFPPLFYDTEVSVNLDAGIFLARAGAVTYNLGKKKIGATEIDTIIVDSDAQYSKSKLAATIAGAVTWYGFDAFFLKAILSYRLAEVGRMVGTVRRLEGTFEEESFSNFDFSGFSASLGVGITF